VPESGAISLDTRLIHFMDTPKISIQPYEIIDFLHQGSGNTYLVDITPLDTVTRQKQKK